MTEHPQPITVLSESEVQAIEVFRKSRNTAVLAIMFTDVVGSTRATELLGDQAYSRLRHVHDDLIRNIVSRDGIGTVVKEIGDSFLCVFSEPSAAVERAIEIQKVIRANKDNLSAEGYTLNVRIGINLGQVAVENALHPDIFGRHVNLAARIEALAGAGQVLTSRSVWENAAAWVSRGSKTRIAHVSYGKVRLKGFGQPVDIYGFYETGKPVPPAPMAIRRRKQRRMLLTTLAILLVAVTASLLFRILGGHKSESELAFTNGKAYYIQFDLSALGNNIPTWLDTTAVKEAFVSQAIAAFSPNPVWTDDEIISKHTQLGLPFKPHRIKGSSDDAPYYRDTLGLAGVLLVRAQKRASMNDTVVLHQSYLLFPRSNEVSSVHLEGYLPTNQLERFAMTSIQEAVLKSHRRTVGAVLAADDKTFTFKLGQDVHMSKGAKLTLIREYVASKGLRSYMEDKRAELAHFRSLLQDQTELTKWRMGILEDRVTDSDVHKSSAEMVQGIVDGLARDSANIEEQLLGPVSTGSVGYSTGVFATVVSVTDSVALARWECSYKRMERPRPGDLVEIDF